MSVLPGLRHARTPLAAGLLWLFVGWLILGSSDDADLLSTGALGQRLVALADYVGPTGVLAAASFLAVLLGGLIPGFDLLVRLNAESGPSAEALRSWAGPK